MEYETLVEDLLHKSSRSTRASAGIFETRDIRTTVCRVTSKIMACDFISIEAQTELKTHQLMCFVMKYAD